MAAFRSEGDMKMAKTKSGYRLRYRNAARSKAARTDHLDPHGRDCRNSRGEVIPREDVVTTYQLQIHSLRIGTLLFELRPDLNGRWGYTGDQIGGHGHQLEHVLARASSVLRDAPYAVVTGSPVLVTLVRALAANAPLAAARVAALAVPPGATPLRAARIVLGRMDPLSRNSRAFRARRHALVWDVLRYSTSYVDTYGETVEEDC